MSQESEVVGLFLGLASILSVICLCRGVARPEVLPTVVSLLTPVAASVGTVLEGLAYARLLNSVEHICYAASGLLDASAEPPDSTVDARSRWLGLE